MGEDNLAMAMAFVIHQRPKLRKPLHAYALIWEIAGDCA